MAPLSEHFQIPPSRIPGSQSLGKKEICREGWDLGFIYPNETKIPLDTNLQVSTPNNMEMMRYAHIN
jgi:hypothetical protein